MKMKVRVRQVMAMVMVRLSLQKMNANLCNVSRNYGNTTVCVYVCVCVVRGHLFKESHCGDASSL